MEILNLPDVDIIILIPINLPTVILSKNVIGATTVITVFIIIVFVIDAAAIAVLIEL